MRKQVLRLEQSGALVCKRHMSLAALKKPSLLRRAKDQAHRVQNALRPKGPGLGMRTDVTAGGKPVLFSHNPRTGGRSLEAFLNVKRLSHGYPVEKLTEQQWLDHFIVSSVRHPIDRFFSGYFGLTRKGETNSLIKQFGWGVTDLNALEFFELTEDFPRHNGVQTQWTDFPSAEKPRADLVLRLEEVDQWVPQMLDAGLSVEGRVLPHKGKTDKSGTMRDLSKLGLTEPEYLLLCEKIEARHASDYDTFGYERGSRI